MTPSLPGQNCYDPFRAIAVQDLGVGPRHDRSCRGDADEDEPIARRDRHRRGFHRQRACRPALHLGCRGLRLGSLAELDMLLDLAAGEGIALDAILADAALGAPGDRPIPLIAFDGHADAAAHLADLERDGVVVFSDHVALDSDADLETSDDASEPNANRASMCSWSRTTRSTSSSSRRSSKRSGSHIASSRRGREGIDAWLELRPRLVFVDFRFPTWILMTWSEKFVRWKRRPAARPHRPRRQRGRGLRTRNGLNPTVSATT